MYLVKTYLDKSGIHGMGVFAGEDIPKGTIVWDFVEGVDQACMKTSFEAGSIVTLNAVDTFCDGTAVTRPGENSYDICRKYIDAYITVTNEEVAAGIQRMWDAARVIPEPSGAMGLA